MLRSAEYLVVVVEYPDRGLVCWVAATSCTEEEAPVVEHVVAVWRIGTLHEVGLQVGDFRLHYEVLLLDLRHGFHLRRFEQLITVHEIGLDLIRQPKLSFVILASQLLNSILLGGSRFLMSDRDVFEILLDNLKILALLGPSIHHFVVVLAP